MEMSSLLIGVKAYNNTWQNYEVSMELENKGSNSQFSVIEQSEDNKNLPLPSPINLSSHSLQFPLIILIDYFAANSKNLR